MRLLFVFILRWKISIHLHPSSPSSSIPKSLVDVTAYVLIGSTPTHLGAVEVLGPAGTVGPANGRTHI